MDALDVLLEEFNNLPPLEREQKVVEVAMEMAEDAMIDKACEWLKDMACYYAYFEVNGDTYENEIVYDEHKLIEDFRKAMKG